MDQYDQDTPMNESQDRKRQSPDRRYNSSETGLVGDTASHAADDTSKSGVAGSSTFDPRVSPAHEGLVGSSEIRAEVDDAPYSAEQVGQRGAQVDQS